MTLKQLTYNTPLCIMLPIISVVITSVQQRNYVFVDMKQSNIASCFYVKGYYLCYQWDQ